MAQDAVDLAVRLRGLSAGPSRTASLRLVDFTPPASAPLLEGLPLTRDGIEFAVRAEGALSPDDVLDRRTRVGLVDADRTRALPVVAELVTAVLTQFD
jgi:glycerol-3-phosphate dehydrogenase